MVHLTEPRGAMASHADRVTFHKILLACGIASSLLYVGMNVFIPLRWAGYSVASTRHYCLAVPLERTRPPETSHSFSLGGAPARRRAGLLRQSLIRHRRLEPVFTVGVEKWFATRDRAPLR